MNITIIVFFIFGFFLTRWLVKSFNHNHFVGMLAGMIVCMVLVYCIVPILLLLLKKLILANNIVYGFDDLYTFIFRTTNHTNYFRLFINFSIGILGLYLGYKNFNEFKKNNKEILDNLFKKEQINDNILMTILVLSFINTFIKDQKKLKLIIEKAKKEVKKNFNKFDDSFLEEFGNKILKTLIK